MCTVYQETDVYWRVPGVRTLRTRLLYIIGESSTDFEGGGVGDRCLREEGGGKRPGRPSAIAGRGTGLDSSAASARRMGGGGGTDVQRCQVPKELAMMQMQLSTGEFTLLDDLDYDRVGQWRWGVNSSGYVRRTLKRRGLPNKTLLLHRYLLNARDGEQVDHINRNKLDNRRTNLRFLPQALNVARRRPWHHKRSTPYKGVQRRGMKWSARIYPPGNPKYVWLGLFVGAEEAARAYDTKAQALYGENAYLNFPCA